MDCQIPQSRTHVNMVTVFGLGMKNIWNRLFVGLIGLSLIAGVMMLSNPSKSSYLEYISDQLAADAQTDLCKEKSQEKSQESTSEPSPSLGLRDLVKEACDASLRAIKGITIATISNATTRQDLTLLSIYTTEVPASLPESLPSITFKDRQLNINTKVPTRKYKTLAAFGHFYPLDRK